MEITKRTGPKKGWFERYPYATCIREVPRPYSYTGDWLWRSPCHWIWELNLRWLVDPKTADFAGEVRFQTKGHQLLFELACAEYVVGRE